MTSVVSQTGTGSTFVMSTSPTLVTPDIGAAIGTSLVLSGNVTAEHLIGAGVLPLTVVWGNGAGAGPIGTSIDGKDLGGSISFTSGTAPQAGGIIATITFSTAYSSAPSAIILSAGTSDSGLDMNRVYVSNITTTTFDIRATSTAISGGTYKFYFMVVE